MLENLVDGLVAALDWLPHGGRLEFAFMRRALLGLLLIAPLCATIGIQVVNFRLAFFAEAVGHSAITGIGLGYALSLTPMFAGVDPAVTMSVFGVLVALAITFYRRSTGLSSDTVIGVFSAAVIAFGLCVLTGLRSAQRLPSGTNLETFLIGNILTIRTGELAVLILFFVAAMVFEFVAYNRLMFIGLNGTLAQTVGLRVKTYEYCFAVLLALVVMFSIRAVGVLLVTALLVIPAAAARNLARSAGGVFWWGLGIALSSAVGGLILSDVLGTATGATIVLATACWFVLAAGVASLAGRS